MEVDKDDRRFLPPIKNIKVNLNRLIDLNDYHKNPYLVCGMRVLYWKIFKNSNGVYQLEANLGRSILRQNLKSNSLDIALETLKGPAKIFQEFNYKNGSVFDQIRIIFPIEKEEKA